MASEHKVRAIREHLQVIASMHERADLPAERKADRIRHEVSAVVHLVDQLATIVEAVEMRVKCPLEGQCPVMNAALVEESKGPDSIFERALKIVDAADAKRNRGE